MAKDISSVIALNNKYITKTPVRDTKEYQQPIKVTDFEITATPEAVQKENIDTTITPQQQVKVTDFEITATPEAVQRESIDTTITPTYFIKGTPTQNTGNIDGTSVVISPTTNINETNDQNLTGAQAITDEIAVDVPSFNKTEKQTTLQNNEVQKIDKQPLIQPEQISKQEKQATLQNNEIQKIDKQPLIQPEQISKQEKQATLQNNEVEKIRKEFPTNQATIIGKPTNLADKRVEENTEIPKEIKEISSRFFSDDEPLIENLSLSNTKQTIVNGIDNALQRKILEASSRAYDGLKNTRPGEIGFLYVKPISTSSGFLPYRIPFEFNPKIVESGLQAKYNAVSFLSRIGDVQNFIGVSPLTVSINAEYEVLSTGSNTGDNDTDYWLNYYTLEALDNIEMAYRSLILPDYIVKTNSQTTQNTYLRPPVIKIILGDEKTLNLQSNQSNLDYTKGQFEFSYPAKSSSVREIYNTNKILSSQSQREMRFHKLFIATSLNINKDIEKQKISMKNGINRITGFSVDLTLVEVSENYMDLMPDFKVYYEFFKNASTPRRGN